jgi:hypothetical protein
MKGNREEEEKSGKTKYRKEKRENEKRQVYSLNCDDCSRYPTL